MIEIFAPLTSEASPLLQKIEVASFFQIPSFHIIGLPAPEVNEARERIRSAIEASDLEFPRRRIILNLAPAHIRKKGTGIDLAMALGILAHPLSTTDTSATYDHPTTKTPLRIGAWGELGLDGSIKAIGQITRALYAAWAGQLCYLLIAKQEVECALQALQLFRQSHQFEYPVPQLICVSTLQHCWELLKDPQKLLKEAAALEKFTSHDLQQKETQAPTASSLLLSYPRRNSETTEHLMPLSPSLERTLILAITGGHHLLLLGPKGAGKSHAFDWLTQLQPQPPLSEQIQHRLLHELLPRSTSVSNIRRIPPQIRPAALLGSTHSSHIRPGEYSMAHGGLLLADEFLEWARDSRESLREPLERRSITLTRIQGSVELPASFLFAANGNLCPCGGWPHTLPKPQLKTGSLPYSPCSCSFASRKKYLDRLSGPILDRIDLITILIPQLRSSAHSETQGHLNQLKERIYQTQQQLIQRWGKLPSSLNTNTLESILKNQQCSSAQPASIFETLTFTSLRARHKVIRVALTLAALDGCSEPTSGHWFEAHHYRAEQILN